MPLLVDSHKPWNSSQFIGNLGCLQKLKEHLLNWRTTWQPSTTPGILLSGPSGIGKNTAIEIIARELNYDIIEFNASHTRSMATIRNAINTSLNYNTLTKYFPIITKNIQRHFEVIVNGYINQIQTSFASNSTFYIISQETINTIMKYSQPIHQKLSNKIIVIDELNGMSSTDRGGIPQLVRYLRISQVPMIFIYSNKRCSNVYAVRKYCVQFRFKRPSIRQIYEKLDHLVDIKAISQLAEQSNFDIRNILNTIQFHKSHSISSSSIICSQKDKTYTVWNVSEKLFEQNVTIETGIEYYFVEYSSIPMFIQENYLNVNLEESIFEEMDCICSAANSIADGDVLDSIIRQKQMYSLLPFHGVVSSLKPAQYMSCLGTLSRKPLFPEWFGKNSKRKSNKRLICNIAKNMNGNMFESDEKENVNVRVRSFRMDHLDILYLRNNVETDCFLKSYNISKHEWNLLQYI